MNNGGLQQILNMNSNIRTIQVKYPNLLSTQMGFVTDVAFDKKTRSIIFLSISKNPKMGVDKFHLIKTFLFDLKGSHLLLCKDIDSQIVYNVALDYTINGKVLTLNLLR